ncbi:Asp-tRNA(Asn)/Glu-tRNA(Gln) amidotransferase subunit GatA [Slackia heliotrinireducens]|uniref:Asp-tRNA(Asn)/Glu-tRNA(Gln) amidotransferase subunit GatA n=1 Tax=Slackia heliotrinireducens TaxID=84110 RepID=UPI00331570FB
MAYATDMGVSRIHEGLAAGEFSACDVVDATLAHIKQADPQLHAFLELTEDAARAAAVRVDEAIANGTFGQLGPLAGVPIAFKDNMNLKGTRTTCASHMLETYVSPYTATCVQRMLDAGCLPLGKLNMDEFAFGSTTENSAFGPTRNPWDPDRVPGGSSGGSAAAVASGMTALALGSDTGGSIRQPAGFCGVVGVKPTYGMVSRYGVVAFGSSLDQVGPFARSVKDAAFALDALCGRDPMDCTSQDVEIDFVAATERPVEGARVGIVPSFMEAEGLSSEVKARVAEAAAKLEAAGATLVEVDLPHADAAISAYYVLAPCEAFSNLARFDSVRYGCCDAGHTDLGGQYEASRAKGFGAEAKRRILLGSYLLSSGVYDEYYVRAQKVRTLITQDFRRTYGQCDVILSPVAPTVAPKFGELAEPAQMYLSDVFTIALNIAGNGGMTVPCGLGRDSGMPVGVQLMAPQFQDGNMFAVASELERIFGQAQVAPAFAPKAGE